MRRPSSCARTAASSRASDPGARHRITLPGWSSGSRVAGALFLGIVAVAPFIVSRSCDLGGLGLGGTGLLIVVSVVVETMKQIEAQLMMRNYEGFIGEVVEGHRLARGARGRQGDAGAGPRRAARACRTWRPATCSGPPSATARRSGRRQDVHGPRPARARRRDDQHAARAPGAAGRGGRRDPRRLPPQRGAGRRARRRWPRGSRSRSRPTSRSRGRDGPPPLGPLGLPASGHVYNEVANRPRTRASATSTARSCTSATTTSQRRARPPGAQLPPLFEVVDHYRTRGVLVSVDGDQAIEA